MAGGLAPRRYAQAAFEIAVERAALAAWRSDLADIAQVLCDSAAAPVLADNRVAVERRLAVVERALDVQPLALNLAKLLVTRGRSLDARAVADAFNGMADEREGIARAQLTTAVELPPERLSQIEQRLSTALGKRVTARATVDPAILGGIVVRVGDRVIDGSLRTRLRSLRRELQGAL